MSKKAIAVIGEGITEKYYIESLKLLTDFTIVPQELGKKASNLSKLKANIEKAIKERYDEVYCLIDMDGKRDGKSKIDYIALKQKYHKTHEIKRKGIKCQVSFIETERCTELWFLYHFLTQSISREFTSYHLLEKELKKYLPNYEKKEKYFQGIRKLHEELTKKNGSLTQAITNSKESIISKERDGRDFTYSEMHLLMEALGIKDKE